MIFWAALRSVGGGGVADAFVLLAHVAFFAFLWSAVPLVKNDGYQWMALLLGQPQLRQRSLNFLGMRLRGKPAPPDMSAADQTCALLFALANIIFLAGVVILIFCY